MIGTTQLIGLGATALLVTYGAYTCYQAGKASTQAEWDQAKAAWQIEKGQLQSRIISSERSVVAAQKEAQDANAEAQRAAEARIAAHRTKSDAAIGRLQQYADQLSKRIAASADDSAALGECKAIASTYQGLFSSCTLRYRGLGETATRDLARAQSSGLECERSYDAAQQALKKLGEAGQPH